MLKSLSHVRHLVSCETYLPNALYSKASARKSSSHGYPLYDGGESGGCETMTWQIKSTVNMTRCASEKRYHVPRVMKAGGQMHPRFLRGLAAAFVGGCAVALACVAHDNTAVSNPPPPIDATPPTRFVVDSGVVTLPGSDSAGIGSTCHLLLQDCGNTALVCYPGARGVGICLAPTGTGGELANCGQQSDCAQGYYCGNGGKASTVCMILCDVVDSACPKSFPCLEVPGFTDNTGYCLE